MKLPFNTSINVNELKGLVNMEPGAPCPVIIADDINTIALFYAKSTWSEEQREELLDSSYAIKFHHCIYHTFGTPNDEVLSGHPYFQYGLGYYGFYEVENSDLIGRLKKINSIHPFYNAKSWEEFRHFILTFHDNTFECVAKSFEIKKENLPPHEYGLSLFKSFD